jgi:anaerobic selenocysteine-containing dehydrogenase
MPRDFLERLAGPPEVVETSPKVADEVKSTTCYMCACRCGIHVHLKDGKIRYIEGNKRHPVNRGVLCAKGSAGIMQQMSPAKLTKPLLRVGERGKAAFKEIEWDEALRLATEWLGEIRRTDPRRLAFFTGRDQSQSLTGWWATQFGTPNFAAHGGFCSVNMAAGGLYSVGGSFWEFGEVDWERTRLFLLFGVAEDHDSNPIKLGLARLKARGAKIVSVNPVRTGYSAIADEWVGIKPGADGLFVLAIVHELLKSDRIDLDFLARYTNAPWLVRREDGLFARDAEGRTLVWDKRANAAAPSSAVDVAPQIAGEVTLADGTKAVPVLHLVAERYLDAQYAPEAVAERCGVPAETIRRLAAEIARAAFDEAIVLEQPWTDWAGRRHATMIGRPVSMHAMRGISAHSNGFQTCRALHLLQMLIGAVDTPGAWRYKAPFPRHMPLGPKPAGKTTAPETPLQGSPLGFPTAPEDLLVEADGTPKRIDKAYSWEAPFALHGLMHMVVRNAWAADPYAIDTLFMYMANMSWNSAMSPPETMRMLTDKKPDGSYKIPRIIYSDAYFSEMVAYADLVLPDTTYLERWDCISMLDRPIGSAEGPGDAIRQPVLKPDRDVRPFQDVLIELGARLKLPGFVAEDGTPRYKGGYPDYLVNHERKPGIGPLMGWRGENGKPNPEQLQRYIENGCFWRGHLPEEALYYKHANKAYLEAAKRMGFVETTEQIVLQLYVEPLQKFRRAAEGHGPVQPPEHLRRRVATDCDPLPFWHPALDETDLPLAAVTQRAMPMYHSWHSQNAWLRQILSKNHLYVHRATAERLGLADGDWVEIEGRSGAVRAPIRLSSAVNPDTVWTWNAIGKRTGAWNLDPAAPEGVEGFLLNHLIADLLPDGRLSNSDPVTGQAAWYDLRIKLRKVEGAAETAPRFEPLTPPEGLARRPTIVRWNP